MHRRFVANAQAFRLSCYGTDGSTVVPKNGYIFMSSRGRFAARASPSGNLIGYADRRILNSALPM